LNKGNTVNQEQEIKDLKEQVARLEKLLTSVQTGTATPSNRMASGILAREARRLDRQEKAAKQVADSKPVRVRVQRFSEKLVEKRVVKIDASRPIVLSSTWRTRGIWPDAPNVLEPFNKDGKPIIHEMPERVFKALQPEVRLATSLDEEEAKVDPEIFAETQRDRARDNKVRSFRDS
jgi:hypothetical protein